MILRCEMCLTNIGTFDPETLALPLQGAMFAPLGPGYIPPFPAEAGWLDLLCPICRLRAMGWDLNSHDMVRPNRLLTPEGYFIVGQGLEHPPAPPYVHDSEDLAKEWAAVEAARAAARAHQRDEAGPEPAPIASHLPTHQRGMQKRRR